MTVTVMVILIVDSLGFRISMETKLWSCLQEIIWVLGTGGKTHLECGLLHSMGYDPGLNGKET